jgi:hypothetical protein
MGTRSKILSIGLFETGNTVGSETDWEIEL